MTLSFLESASFWSQIAVVVFTVSAAIAGIFALYFSSKVDSLKEERIANLQKMVEPRRLSDVAEATLFEQLSKFTNKGVVEIDCVEGDHEGAKFAHQIQQVFKKAGWEAGRVERYAYTGLAPTGLLLTVQPDNRPYAKALGTIFNAAGFSVRFSESPTLGSSTARVTVGIKPQ